MDVWRGNRAALPSGLNLILAIWVFISPWVLGFSSGSGNNLGAHGLGAGNGSGSVHTTMLWNHVVCGVVLFILSAIRFWGNDTLSTISWFNAAIGVWIFISPWVLGDSNVTRIVWNCIISGAVIFFLGAWSALLTQRRAL